LARQTNKDYELICVDDLSKDRKEEAAKYALQLNIPLKAIVSSKPKLRGKRFGQCNAINTGGLRKYSLRQAH
jgi:glycosyltransferase involved in cell wall biosynthesis